MAKATIKMVAERAGVSRGTVDRVLNNRPYVKKEIAERVRQAIQELDYKPNAAAKALRTKKDVRIAIIIPPVNNRFFASVAKGVEKAASEYEEYGVTVELMVMREDTIEEQMRLMQGVENGQYGGVALAPFDALAVKRAAKRIIARDIPLVTFHTDLKHLDNLCFVGQDNVACGKVAAQLMDYLLCGSGKVLVSIGKRNIYSDIQQVESFRRRIAKSHVGISVVEEMETFANDDKSYKLCWGAFSRNSDIKGIFVTGGGLGGICKFLEETSRAGDVKVISTDFVDRISKHLKKGSVQFAIGQHAYRQGYYTTKILAEYLLGRAAPKRNKIYSRIEIMTGESVGSGFISDENDILTPL